MNDYTLSQMREMLQNLGSSIEALGNALLMKQIIRSYTISDWGRCYRAAKEAMETKDKG